MAVIREVGGGNRDGDVEAGNCGKADAGNGDVDLRAGDEKDDGDLNENRKGGDENGSDGEVNDGIQDGDEVAGDCSECDDDE